MNPVLERLVSKDALAETVERLGRAISQDHPEGVLLVGVLKGGVYFLADLCRAITVPCAIDFLALSSYSPGETRVRITKDLESDVTGRDVVLVEEIVDTGLSASYVVSLLTERGARTIRVCTLLDRAARRILPVDLSYVGIEVSDAYLVGYGLDHKGRYRNLDELYAFDATRSDGESIDLEPVIDLSSSAGEGSDRD